jgi:integrase
MGRKGFWTPEQATAFLRCQADHRLRAAWVIAVIVSARRGELAGLKWNRVDLERGVLFLHWQRTTTSTGVIEKGPKAGASAPLR